MEKKPTLTPDHVRNARAQARCGGHPYISIRQYCEHVDCLFTEIERVKRERVNTVNADNAILWLLIIAAAALVYVWGKT